MTEKLRKWFICQFSITISTVEAIKLGLEPEFNVYGDMINRWNCRSIWRDQKRNVYRIAELIEMK